MITTSQIKAARALLDWTQADLAKASGMHLNVINNIERGTTNPRQGTLEKLQKALEAQGIVLIASRGVELKRDTLTFIRHEGTHFISALISDMLAVLATGDEVLSTLSDIRNFSAHDADASKDWYAQKESRGFNERLITRDMPGFYPRHSENFRVVAAEKLGPVDTILYADRVAHIFWAANEVAILKNADLAATQRIAFDMLWNNGHEPVRPIRAAED